MKAAVASLAAVGLLAIPSSSSPDYARLEHQIVVLQQRVRYDEEWLGVLCRNQDSIAQRLGDDAFGPPPTGSISPVAPPPNPNVITCPP